MRRSSRSNPPKVIFCCYPGFYASLALARLVASAKLQVVGVVRSTRLLRKDRALYQDIPLLLKTSGLRYACYQSAATFGHSLLSAFVTLPTIGELCRQQQLPVLRTRDINCPQGQRFVRELACDYLLTVNFNQKLSAALLAMPAIGAINIHPSLLPDYRGVDPVLCALAEGEQQFGVTLHQMDEALDTGAILAQQTLPIDRRHSLFRHYLQAFRAGAELAVNYLEAAGDEITGRQQPPGGRYFGWPDRRQISCISSLIRLNDLFI